MLKRPIHYTACHVEGKAGPVCGLVLLRLYRCSSHELPARGAPPRISVPAKFTGHQNKRESRLICDRSNIYLF